MNVIETVNLSKKYKQIFAVNNVSMTVKKGEIYGFIGLNGAGKTSLIRMLLALITPTGGECYLNGKNVRKTDKQLWSRVGHIVETPHSYPELTVLENLHIQRQLYRIKNKTNLTNIVNNLHLRKYKDVKAKNLSLGNKQRLGIAKALVHEPDILILDEPMNGLDPKGIVEMRYFLKKLAEEEAVTILISSHLLSEVARLANKIGMIHEGILIEEIDLSTMYRQLRRTIHIETKNKDQAIEVLAKKGIRAKLHEDGKIISNDHKAVHHPKRINQILFEHSLIPSHISVEEEDLEAYFLRKIGTKEMTHHDLLF